jgi:hypothetical protein
LLEKVPFCLCLQKAHTLLYHLLAHVFRETFWKSRKSSRRLHTADIHTAVSMALTGVADNLTDNRSFIV